MNSTYFYQWNFIFHLENQIIKKTVNIIINQIIEYIEKEYHKIISTITKIGIVIILKIENVLLSAFCIANIEN